MNHRTNIVVREIETWRPDKRGKLQSLHDYYEPSWRLWRIHCILRPSNVDLCERSMPRKYTELINERFQ